MLKAIFQDKKQEKEPVFLLSIFNASDDENTYEKEFERRIIDFKSNLVNAIKKNFKEIK